MVDNFVRPKIVFRGIDKDTNTFVYGYYVCDENGNNYIVPIPHLNSKEYSVQKNILVYSNSVKEFSGIYDKDGRMIFEHDIVEHSFDNNKKEFDYGGKYKVYRNLSYFIGYDKEKDEFLDLYFMNTERLKVIYYEFLGETFWEQTFKE